MNCFKNNQFEILEKFGWKQNHFTDFGVHRKELFKNRLFPEFRLHVHKTGEWRILMEDGSHLPENPVIRDLGNDNLTEEDLLEIEKCLNTANTIHLP